MANQIISVDIETTGPAPGTGSMISLGACIVDLRSDKIGDTFEVNIDEQYLRDEETMRWWDMQAPAAWLATQLDTKDPKEAMADFAAWISLNSPGDVNPQFWAWPAGFDWSFVNYYFWKYHGSNPFGHSPFCSKSFMRALGDKATKLIRKNTKKRYRNENDHVALYDAIEQGYGILEMLKFHRKTKNDTHLAG